MAVDDYQIFNAIKHPFSKLIFVFTIYIYNLEMHRLIG